MNGLDQAVLHFLDDWRNPVGVAATAVVLFVALLYWEQSRFIAAQPAAQFAAQHVDGPGDVCSGAGDHARLERSGVSRQADRSEEPQLQGDRHRKISEPQPDALCLRGNTVRGRAAQERRLSRRSRTRTPWPGRSTSARSSPASRPRESMLFFFAMDPRKVLSVDEHGKWTSMMDDIDEVPEADKRTLLAALQGYGAEPVIKSIMGKGRMAAINKKVGERIKVTSLNLPGARPGDGDLRRTARRTLRTKRRDELRRISTGPFEPTTKASRRTSSIR